MTFFAPSLVDLPLAAVLTGLAVVFCLLLAIDLYREGRAFDWWALPGALGLGLWASRGAVRQPEFLATLALFLVLVCFWILRHAGTRSQAARTSVGQRGAAEPGRDSVSGASERAQSELRLAPPLELGSARDEGWRVVVPAPPVSDALDPQTDPGGDPKGAPSIDLGTPPPPPEFGLRLVPPSAAEPQALPPPVDLAVPVEPTPVIPPSSHNGSQPDLDLLVELVPFASPQQRDRLWPQLRANHEIVERADGRPATLRWSEGRWGEERVEGATLEWDHLDSTASATVIAVQCVANELATYTVLVPIELIGVKRLSRREGRSRWAGRSVFVPRHLILLESDR